ncbi:hypothetical protein V2J52_02760 [Georgenia sp. MJ173]|uniref:hypothetical protein n=1 Tax=Georgenia sunbinii TaxID=3117728 RepID=UPI002F262664
MSDVDSPAILAARLTGTRRAFLASLSDGDGAATLTYRRADRGGVFLTPAGLVDWSTSPLPGDATAWRGAEPAVGGAAR